MRASGILLPIFSLPSKYGIGTFGDEAYNFINFLKKAGQSYWQILPLSPTSYGDSPYQSFSAFAGNLYFIDLDLLCNEGYLNYSDYTNVDFGNGSSIDYSTLFKNRFNVLKAAYKKFDIKNSDFLSFVEENAFWLDDYALFMAIKENNDNKSWQFWPVELKFRDSHALFDAKYRYEDAINFHKVVQFWFYKQWFALKKYANDTGVKIIGDIPIYVALDSADVWANPQYFLLNEKLIPTVVAGCPPDSFTAKGQLWGNPLYDWKYMDNENTPYSWWCKRIEYTIRLYDVVRVDHFRGFESYYAIKYGKSDATIGEWCKGPEKKLFQVLKNKFKTLPIIAEDLGFITEEVRDLLKFTGFPGMKVLQFGFDKTSDNEHLPHNCHKNCVVYTGTHDNDNILGWISNLDCDKIEFLKNYLRVDDIDNISETLISAAFSTNSDTVIIPMQDYLGLSSKARINTPSTVGENWKWRVDKKLLTDKLADKICNLTDIYGRLN